MATIDIIIKATDKASKEFDKISGSAEKMGKSMGRVGKSMTKNLTLPIVAIGVAAVKAASDMDTALRNIQSVGKQTEDQIQALSQTFRDMSISAEFGTETAAGLAEAYFDIQGAGFAGAEAMTVLEASTIAATAGATTTTVAMEGLTAVLNSYGKEAEDAIEVSDQMFRTVDRGVGSFESLAGALPTVTGLASAMNIEFETVSAAMATMSKQGKTFETASVELNQVLLGFLKPTKAMSKALAELGFESGQAAIDQLGLAGALNAVTEVTGGTAEGMTDLFSSVRGVRGALALTGKNAQMFSEDLEAMGDAAGAANDAMEIQMQSFDNQLKLFKNNFTAILIEIGNIVLPVLNKIMSAITPIIQAFSGLDETTKTWIVTIAALVAVIGPVLIITAQMISAFMAVKSAILAIRTAMIALNIVSMMNPWVAIIALVAAGVLILVNNWDQFKSGVQFVWDMMKGFFEFLLAGGGAGGMLLRALGLDDVFMAGLERFKSGLSNIIEFLKQIPSQMVEIGKSIIQGLAQGIQQGMDYVIEALTGQSGVASTIVNGMKKFFAISSPSLVMDQMGQNISVGLAQGINKGWNAMGGLQPLADNISQGMQQIANGVAQGIAQIGDMQAKFGGAAEAGSFGGVFGSFNKKSSGGGGSGGVDIQGLANAMKAAGNDFNYGIGQQFGVSEDSDAVKQAFNLNKNAGGLSPKGGGGGGGGNIVIKNNVFKITDESDVKQAKRIMKILAKDIQKKYGISGRSLTT